MFESFDIGKYEEKMRYMAMEHLSVMSDPEHMMNQLVEIAEGTLDKHLNDKDQIACKAGCGSCCMLNVAVLFPEVVAIVKHVVDSWPLDRLRQLTERIEDLYHKIRHCNDDEWIGLREHCAFLDDSGNCSIYPVRPLICRSVTSVDPRHCEEALETPASGTARPILMNMFQKSLMETTFIALGDALERMGFDTRSGQLVVGVRQLLEEPELRKKFLNKGEVWDV